MCLSRAERAENLRCALCLMTHTLLYCHCVFPFSPFVVREVDTFFNSVTAHTHTHTPGTEHTHSCYRTHTQATPMCSEVVSREVTSNFGLNLVCVCGGVCVCVCVGGARTETLKRGSETILDPSSNQMHKQIRSELNSTSHNTVHHMATQSFNIEY